MGALRVAPGSEKSRSRSASVPGILARDHGFVFVLVRDRANISEFAPDLSRGASDTRCGTSARARSKSRAGTPGAARRRALQDHSPTANPRRVVVNRIRASILSSKLPAQWFSFHEFLFRALCKRLSIIVDAEWTLAGHRADPERTCCFQRESPGSVNLNRGAAGGVFGSDLAASWRFCLIAAVRAWSCVDWMDRKKSA